MSRSPSGVMVLDAAPDFSPGIKATGPKITRGFHMAPGLRGKRSNGGISNGKHVCFHVKLARAGPSPTAPECTAIGLEC